MIHPTIGRVVLVERANTSQPEPALICYVHSDRCINVAGFTANGTPFAETSIQLLQDDDQPNNQVRYARWMPYQIQTAAERTAKVDQDPARP